MEAREKTTAAKSIGYQVSLQVLQKKRNSRKRRADEEATEEKSLKEKNQTYFSK